MKNALSVCFVTALSFCGCALTEAQKKDTVTLAIEVGMLVVRVLAAYPTDRIIYPRSAEFDQILIYRDKTVYAQDGLVVKIVDF